MPSFKEWETFYVIVGSSAAALTGLQFVVMALIADQEPPPNSRAIDAFGTPTIVHFCAALLVSALLTAPWRAPFRLALVLVAAGVVGAVYSGIIARRATRQTDYQPVVEDWAFHVLLPAAAYATVAAAASLLPTHLDSALFAIAAAVLLLVFVGIHNAWDTVTYIAVVRRIEESARRETATPR